MNNSEELKGGRIGKIYKKDNIIIRPAQSWTTHVHHFLNVLHEEGATFVPKPVAITEQNEELISYMPGEVYNYPLPEKLLTDKTIISAAHLLFNFHEKSKNYIDKLSDHQQWMLPSVEPIEVMCHGDYAPYNVTTKNGVAIGMIDFDTLHPGSRMRDIVYAIYRWVPLTSPHNPNCTITFNEKLRRAALFLDTYGVNNEVRKTTVKLLIYRLEQLMGFIKREAEDGNADFQKNIDEGHLKIYEDDIQFLKQYEKQIVTALIKK